MVKQYGVLYQDTRRALLQTEDAGNAGLAVFVNQCAIGHGVNGNAGGSGQLVFRDQTDRQQQRITGNVALGLLDGLTARIHLRDGHALQALGAVDLHHGGA